MNSDLSIALELIRDRALKHVIASDIHEAARKVVQARSEIRIQRGWTEPELLLIATACEHMKGIA